MVQIRVGRYLDARPLRAAAVGRTPIIGTNTPSEKAVPNTQNPHRDPPAPVSVEIRPFIRQIRCKSVRLSTRFDSDRSVYSPDSIQIGPSIHPIRFRSVRSNLSANPSEKAVPNTQNPHRDPPAPHSIQLGPFDFVVLSNKVHLFSWY